MENTKHYWKGVAVDPAEAANWKGAVACEVEKACEWGGFIAAIPPQTTGALEALHREALTAVNDVQASLTMPPLLRTDGRGGACRELADQLERAANTLRVLGAKLDDLDQHHRGITDELGDRVVLGRPKKSVAQAYAD